MDLGTLDATGFGSSGAIPGVGPPGLFSGQVSTHTHFTDAILRGGLNYKFY
jgi:hypothetical protein